MWDRRWIRGRGGRRGRVRSHCRTWGLIVYFYECWGRKVNVFLLGRLGKVSPENGYFLVDTLDSAVWPARNAVLAAGLFEHRYTDAKVLGCIVDGQMEVVAQSGFGNIFFMVNHIFFFIFRKFCRVIFLFVCLFVFLLMTLLFGEKKLGKIAVDVNDVILLFCYF